MNNLQVGFSRVNINPTMGIKLHGYYQTRYSEAILDDLEINAIAIESNGTKVVMLSMDHCGPQCNVTDDFRKHVAEVCGISEDAIYISCTHTHTGPFLIYQSEDPVEQEYYRFVYNRIGDAAKFAFDDLKPAKMGFGRGEAPDVAFIRRYRMKDGSVRTNPGVNNPDIVEPIGITDESVYVLRFDREDSDSIAVVNFANHADVVGGCKVSADWPGFLRRTVEKTFDNTKCIMFNGAEGDVNHVNVHPIGGYLNDTFLDFDDVSRGYLHARYIGRVICGGVLQAFDKVEYVDVESIKFIRKCISIPANIPTPEELVEARKISDLHRAGKDNEIPFEGMMLTTVVAEAERMIRLENSPENFDMYITGIAIGDIAFIGIPGEPFNAVGRGIKETDGWKMVIPTCLTNGTQGYFPMQDSYDEGGYEARCSNFKAGVGELIISESKKLLDELK